ncbi:hypothetical protein ACJIZ3_002053 [Penstemon smallii]|uniref:Uncharacterized protein n=1 Tax=Penstemon smallii TaxID=265156 RepID=A0ABD3U6R6_9LAMI
MTFVEKSSSRSSIFCLPENSEGHHRAAVKEAESPRSVNTMNWNNNNNNNNSVKANHSHIQILKIRAEDSHLGEDKFAGCSAVRQLQRTY